MRNFFTFFVVIGLMVVLISTNTTYGDNYEKQFMDIHGNMDIVDILLVRVCIINIFSRDTGTVVSLFRQSPRVF